MSINIGDYVRTKDGDIFQITGSDIEFASEIGSDGNLPFNAKIISSEIIDLIDDGDYVNGMLVTSIETDNKGKYVFGYDSNGFEGELWYYNDQIKTIVTKEQFLQMEYKIGEQ